MLKSEARKLYKEKRQALSAIERAKMDDLMLIQLQTVQLPFITFLLSYWPIEENHEPNTHLFTDYLEFQNPDLIICYPKTNFEKDTMQAVQTNEDTRFHKNGFRIGYGKGFYDRYLSQCRSECLKIGFSYFEPLDTIDDANEFDVPLNLCVTPTTVYVF